MREQGDRLVLILRSPMQRRQRVHSDARARDRRSAERGWFGDVRAAIAYRPPAWERSPPQARRAASARAVPRAAADPRPRSRRAILVCDGGEFGQWAQAVLSAARRIINGVAGSIGASIPFAIAARTAEPTAPMIAVLGDGTFGFHMAEFDTAVRHDLPFVAIVGNDAAWNAEHQIQLREYGRGARARLRAAADALRSGGRRRSAATASW